MKYTQPVSSESLVWVLIVLAHFMLTKCQTKSVNKDVVLLFIIIILKYHAEYTETFVVHVVFRFLL